MLDEGMSRFRIMVVSTFLCVIVLGHLVDAWKQQDHWPFACYPMFARLNKAEPFTSESLWGVTLDGREIPLTSEMTGIMGVNRIRPSLMRLYLQGQRMENPAPVRGALLGLLTDYETRREKKQHDGPPLAALRFYQLRWEYDRWARNRDTPQRTVLVQMPPPVEPIVQSTQGEQVRS